MGYITETVFVIQDEITKLYFDVHRGYEAEWVAIPDQARHYSSYSEAEAEITNDGEEDTIILLQDGTYSIKKVFIKRFR